MVLAWVGGFCSFAYVARRPVSLAAGTPWWDAGSGETETQKDVAAVAGLQMKFDPGPDRRSKSCRRRGRAVKSSPTIPPAIALILACKPYSVGSLLCHAVQSLGLLKPSLARVVSNTQRRCELD